MIGYISAFCLNSTLKNSFVDSSEGGGLGSFQNKQFIFIAVYHTWFISASCRRLDGTEVVIVMSQTITSGHWAATCHMYVFHPHETLLVVTA
jgi:6-phosphogluconolactonase (cycloisomerase 2 family)